MSWKSLGDIYSESVRGKEIPKPPRMYGYLQEAKSRSPKSGEERQGLLGDIADLGADIDQSKAGIYRMPQSAKKAERGQMYEIDPGGDEPEDEQVEFDENDIDALNSLPAKQKNKILKLMLRGDIKNTLHSIFMSNTDSEDITDDAVDALLHGTTTHPEISKLAHQIKTNSAVDIEKMQSVGTYKALDVFTKEAWRAFKDMRGVGVGANQAGPGEAALAVLSPKINLSIKGDIEIEGNIAELKVDKGRVGKDSGWPSLKDMEQLFISYIGIQGLDELRKTQKTVNIEVFYDFMHKNKELEPLARDVMQKLFDEPWASMLFDSIMNDPKPVFVKNYNTALFDSYKQSKEGGLGEWDYLIGISTAGEGSVAVVSTGEEYADPSIIKRLKHTPSVLIDGPAGMRSYMSLFDPRA